MYGVDLITSPHARPDWSRVQASGRSFAYVRAGYGCTLDPAFADEWRAMRGHQLLRGAWQALRRDEDPAEQAIRFLKAVELQRGDLPPMVDIEYLDGVAPSVIAAMLAAWLAVVESELEARHGCVPRPIVRASSHMWPSATNGHRLDHALWIVDPFHFDTPVVPTTWRDDEWMFHQYTLGTRGVPGLAGIAQLDRFHACALGARGRRVEYVKRLLRAAKMPEVPDGPELDLGTRAAIVRFQTKRGLVEDGIVGPRTYAELHWP